MKSNDSSQSNSKSEDTPLYETEDAELQGLIDWILFEPAYTPVDMKKKILGWHKAEIAKLFEQIRSEVIKPKEHHIIVDTGVATDKCDAYKWGKEADCNCPAGERNQLRAEQLEALTRMEGNDE